MRVAGIIQDEVQQVAAFDHPDKIVDGLFFPDRAGRRRPPRAGQQGGQGKKGQQGHAPSRDQPGSAHQDGDGTKRPKRAVGSKARYEVKAGAENAGDTACRRERIDSACRKPDVPPAREQPYHVRRRHGQSCHRKYEDQQRSQRRPGKFPRLPKPSKNRTVEEKNGELVETAQKNRRVQCCVRAAAVRHPATQYITCGQGQHHHGDHAAPNVDGVAEVRGI